MGTSRVRRYGRLLAAVGAGVLAAASTGAATVVLVPARDNTMYSESGSKSNGSGEHIFAGRTAMGLTRRALMAFDVTPIPAGSIIHGASLEMYCSKAAPGSPPQSVRLHRLLASWGEAGSDGGLEEGQGGDAQSGDATWTARFFGFPLPWSPPGGEFQFAASGAASVGLPGFFYTWSAPEMAADVQAWLDDPTGNHGWALVANEATPVTARRFGSRQNGFDGF